MELEVRTLKYEMRSASDLRPSAANPRRHPKKQIDDLIRSIQAYGFTNPVLIDEQDEVIAGHGRLIAAKRMRLDEVPTLTVDGLNDEQKRALRIADNKIAQGSSWDTDLLNSELVALSNPNSASMSHSPASRVQKSTARCVESAARSMKLRPRSGLRRWRRCRLATSGC